MRAQHGTVLASFLFPIYTSTSTPQAAIFRSSLKILPQSASSQVCLDSKILVLKFETLLGLCNSIEAMR
ncbi:hypothetical protein XENOCAPTIV_024889 [Xenoophorus captivus]|uniref:Uncharacterized protein n=1 Tax=Xenoophorus captivus TaxID=1517983 RepID=A0ABV0QWJ9_9TELE